MSILYARALAFEFSNGHVPFTNLIFSPGPGLAALVGPNGVGKTTLARILAGELAPTAGKVERWRRVRYFPQRETPPPATVGTYLRGADWSLTSAELLVGIDRGENCANLSGGQWMRVRLAASLVDDYLILDEPTNDLDRPARAAVQRFLRGRDALLISHDRETLRLASEIWELSSRGLSHHGRGWDAYERERAAEQNRLADELRIAQRSREAAIAEARAVQARREKADRRGAARAKRGGIPRLAAGLRARGAEASTGQRTRAARAAAEEAAHSARAAFRRLKQDLEIYPALAGSPLPAHQVVAEARNLVLRHGDWRSPAPIDLNWRGNVRVAIRGANGSGKSSLLRLLAGENLAYDGELRRGTGRALYVDQARRFPAEDESLLANIRQNSTLSETEIRNALAKLLFSAEDVFQSVATLSGGERLRATLARGLLATDRPGILLLDEPTNDLDLANIGALEKIIRGFAGAVVVVSHDEEFLANCGLNESIELGS